MSAITIHKCDRCGREAQTRKDQEDLALKGVAVGLRQYQYGYSNQYMIDNPHRSIDLCFKCRVELGIEIPSNPPENVVVKNLTVEDLIREIVREEFGGGKAE